MQATHHEAIGRCEEILRGGKESKQIFEAAGEVFPSLCEILYDMYVITNINIHR